ncbi:MAG: phosphotransferase family protein [Acidobacteriota bacterium]|jgi:aminoglycoside phosphotransferase (APT) family kinase protein|nr:phosphotransferase family protein [Acidobacteriota bacterium]MDQ3373057.1 phosphotransferase family protein [Acidobacteriota bacterium]
MLSPDTKPMRQGEELNEANLQAFLRENLDLKSDEIEILQFPAGSSNLTYLVKIDGEEFVLRRPPFGNTVKSAHDMKREFDVLGKLSKVYKPAPKPLVYCADENVVGSEFYLMERRKGLIIRGKSPKNLEESKVLQRQVCESFIENLAQLHLLDYEKIGLSELGRPEGYATRQVEGWTKRYFNAKTDDHAEFETTIKWLYQNISNESGAALVHNDYKFDNLMLNPENLPEIAAVLDWEMTTVGDPLMDLGTTLGYWMSMDAGMEMLSMPFNPRVLMENISRQELVEIYEEKSGKNISNILFYYVFGTFKIAVIAQQIYFRYARGFTQDKRFATFNRFVNALGKIALKAIETEKI